MLIFTFIILSIFLSSVHSQSAVFTIAGTGNQGSSIEDANVGGSAINSSFSKLSGIYIDDQGTIFCSDESTHVIYSIDGAGIINIYAGKYGENSFNGDGGSAVDANLNGPIGLTGDNNGNLYIADSENSRIRVVTSNGTINTFAGNGNNDYDILYDGSLATDFPIDKPKRMFFNPDQSRFYFISYLTVNETQEIFYVDMQTNIVSYLAGNGQRAPYFLSFKRATGGCIDKDENIFITDPGFFLIFQIPSNSKNSTIFGGTFEERGYENSEIEGKAPTHTHFYEPRGCAFSPGGIMYINDQINIYKLDPDSDTLQRVFGAGRNFPRRFLQTNDVSDISTGTFVNATDANLEFAADLIVTSDSDDMYLVDQNRRQLLSAFSFAPSATPTRTPSAAPSRRPNVRPVRNPTDAVSGSDGRLSDGVIIGIAICSIFWFFVVCVVAYFCYQAKVTRESGVLDYEAEAREMTAV